MSPTSPIVPTRPRRVRGARRGLALVAALAIGLLLPAAAVAHAELVAASPPDGATVVGAPGDLSATFTEDLIGDSTLSIRDAAGQRLAVGGVDPADARRLVIDPVPDLPPGAYEMRWTAFTADGHLERGAWTFTVTAPPPTSPPATALPTASATADASTSPTPSGNPVPSPSPAASPTPAPGDPTGGDGAAILLPILAALAVVGGGAMLLLGRRGRPGPAA